MESFIYVHNALNIHRKILDAYGSFRDEFDWYSRNDEMLEDIIGFIKEQLLEEHVLKEAGCNRRNAVQ